MGGERILDLLFGYGRFEGLSRNVVLMELLKAIVEMHQEAGCCLEHLFRLFGRHRETKS